MEDIFDKYDELDLQESRLDEDLEPEFLGEDNRECL
jgi:hypothetical protein